MFDFLKKKNATTGESVVLKIDGMHCVSCSLNIDGALEDTKGVISASTNYAKAETQIKFDPGQVSLGQLQKVIRAQGYSFAV